MNKILTFVIFGSLFLFCSFVMISGIEMCLGVVEHNFSIQITELKWLFYGISFGIAFSLFFHAVPSYENRNMPEDDFYRTFKYHFSIFLLFIALVFIWGNVIIWGLVLLKIL